jgi:hypothetical protein
MRIGMKYLVIDAMLSGTGIRDYYSGNYIEPESLHLSDITIAKLRDWLSRYISEHHKGYVNERVTSELDREGKEVALRIKSELVDVKIHYYSDARMTEEIISSKS